MENFETFAEPVEDVPTHELALVDEDDGICRWKSLTNRSQSLGFQIHRGAVATTSSGNYVWNVSYNALKSLFGMVDIAVSHVSLGGNF